jgi:serine/threonine protein kinase
MKSIKKETSGEMEVLLSSDSVLSANPRVTFRWSNKSAEADNRTRGGAVAEDESVGLPTLRPEERTLLALADGRRSIESLAKLAGMTTPVAVRHLRALYDRGILISVDKNAGEASPPSATKWPSDTLSPPAVTEAVLAPPANGPSDQDGVPGGEGEPAAAPPKVNTAAAMTLPGTGPVADKSGPTSPPAGKKAPSGANVTLFWSPANSDSGPVSEGASSPALAVSSEPRPRRNSPEPAVVVVGDSGPTGKVESAKIQPAKVESDSGAAAVPSPAEAQGASVAIPFRVGSYEVATRIAQGGMGSIYVCRRVGAAGFQRLFTLKVIRQHSTQKEVAAKSFTREAQFGTLLNHPNVQTLVDVGDYDGQPFLILDYIEGTSLLELMADNRRPSAAVVVAVMLDVLRALQHIHDVTDEAGQPLGMVHCDVSPHNILVGVDGVARLTDFGSARFSKRDVSSDTEPVAGGKPAYMAPEQLRGDAVDARTDLFSVGVVMWTALTGQKLFIADTYDETVVRVMRRKIPPPSEFGAPPSLDAVVLRALSRSPEGRYSSADEMARDLQAVATAEHLLAPGRDVGQWVRREFGEALADRKRKIQDAFGVPGARADDPSAPARRPHRPTPKTTDGLGRLPAKTVLLEAGEIHAALGAAASAAHRARPSLSSDASRGQWIIVIVSAVIAAFALTAAIIYLVSSLNTPPKKSAGAAAGRPAAVSPSGAGPTAPAPSSPGSPSPSPSPSPSSVPGVSPGGLPAEAPAPR